MLKGTTRIELTNIHTGEKETIEKHNLVTNAIEQLFQPYFGHLTSDSTLRGYQNAYQTLFGGLLLFDDSIPGNANTFYPPAGVNVTGCAVYNVINTESDVYRGSYNKTESVYDEVNRRMTYVYDFNTSQGNGTISSVCLSHANSGYGIYFNSVFHKNDVGLLTSPWSLNVALLQNYKDRSTSLTAGTDEWLFLVDPDQDCLYYLKMTDTTHLEIVKRLWGLKKYSLFVNEKTILDSTTITLSTPITSGTAYYNFDRNDNALYIYSAPSSSVAVNGHFTITKITFGTWGVAQFDVTNTGDAAFTLGVYCYAFDGKFTFLASSTVYMMQIANPANIIKFDATDASFSTYKAVQEINGLILYQSTGQSDSGTPTTYVWIADTTTHKVQRTSQGYLTYFGGSSSWRYNRSAPVTAPVKNYPFLNFYSNGTYTGNGTLGMFSGWLATINNLTEAVVKTADKTMKITYIIEEV